MSSKRQGSTRARGAAGTKAGHKAKRAKTVARATPAGFTLEQAHQVIKWLELAHEGSQFSDQDVGKHVERGCRDIYASHLVRRAMESGCSREEMLVFFRECAERVFPAKRMTTAHSAHVVTVVAVVQALHSGVYDRALLNDDDDRDALLDAVKAPEFGFGCRVWSAWSELAIWFRTNELEGIAINAPCDRAAEHSVRDLVGALCDSGREQAADDFLTRLEALTRRLEGQGAGHGVA